MNEIVKYHNDLNTVPFKRFNSSEMDLFFAICAKMRDKGTNTVTFTFEQLRYLSNYKPTAIQRFVDDLVRTYEKYLNLVYTIENDGIIEKFVLFTGFKVNPHTQQVDITINGDFDYILNELTGNFTRFELEEFTSLNSSYSKTMYRLLKQWRTVGVKEWEISAFRELLDVPDSYPMNKIDTKVLKPIKAELGDFFANLNIQKIKRGHGNKVVALKFTFKPEKVPASLPKRKSKSHVIEQLPDWAKDDAPQEDSELLSADAAFTLLMRLKKFRGVETFDSKSIQQFNDNYGEEAFEKRYKEFNQHK